MAGNLRAFLAEFLGTFAWVFFAAGAVCTDAVLQGRLGPVGVGAAQGLTVAAVFGVFGRYSPGLFNPAFTLSLVVIRRLDMVKAALCLVSQLLGAAIAGLFLAQIFSHTEVGSQAPFLGAAIPSKVLGFRGATLLEAVLTFFLAIAAHRVFEETDRTRTKVLALVLGAVAIVAALVGGPLTGAAMNPARAFGPALASGFWSLHYVYWFGPITGAVAGMGLSQFLFER